MRARLWLFLGIGILLGIGALGAVYVLTRPADHTFAGVVRNTAAADFTLTDEHGKDFALSHLRGQWVLLAYGYTSCPDVCPATLSMLSRVKKDLGAQADSVRVVFVSVDPERDTVDVMAQYVEHFGVDFKGLTGSPEQVAAAAKGYGVKYNKKEVQSAAVYLVNHTAFVYLIDPQFQWRVSYPFGVKPEEITTDLQYLMSKETVQ